MLILSNCLTDTPDEGCVNVANSLAKRLKRQGDATIVSYERHSSLSDVHLTLNKLLLNPKLASLVWKHRRQLLYIPFPSRPITTALRVLMLSIYSGRRVNVLLSIQDQFDPIVQLLFKLSGARFVVLSQSFAEQIERLFGAKRLTYLKTGVDVNRFCPVSPEKKRALRSAYGLDPDRKVILHVGHLKQGRNVQQLMSIDPMYQVVLVTSTLTKHEQDLQLRQQLLAQPNILLLEDYQPRIEEIYQLSDVYFFPVVAFANCIDVPLSCLEAAACNVPVVTTPYGEMREFRGQEGFFHLDSLTAENINAALSAALSLADVNTRTAVLPYHWDRALTQLQHLR